MLHVLPLNDEQEHALDSQCACNPTVQPCYGEMIVTHNSFDCREFVERAIGESMAEDKHWEMVES